MRFVLDANVALTWRLSEGDPNASAGAAGEADHQRGAS